jgi:hypothetical protein
MGLTILAGRSPPIDLDRAPELDMIETAIGVM